MLAILWLVASFTTVLLTPRGVVGTGCSWWDLLIPMWCVMTPTERWIMPTEATQNPDGAVKTSLIPGRTGLNDGWLTVMGLVGT
jgi:hypothetical protein